MFQYIAAPPESTDLCSITVSSFIPFHDVANLVSQLKEKLEGFCKEEVENIFDRGKVSVADIHLLSKISLASCKYIILKYIIFLHGNCANFVCFL